MASSMFCSCNSKVGNVASNGLFLERLSFCSVPVCSSKCWVSSDSKLSARKSSRASLLVLRRLQSCGSRSPSSKFLAERASRNVFHSSEVGFSSCLGFFVGESSLWARRALIRLISSGVSCKSPVAGGSAGVAVASSPGVAMALSLQWVYPYNANVKSGAVKVGGSPKRGKNNETLNTRAISFKNNSGCYYKPKLV